MAKKKGDQCDSDGAEGDQDYDEEPNFDNPQGFVDNVDDDELLGDFLKQKPCESDGVENVIVVDNIPVVGPACFSKLQGVLEKIFKNAGTIVNTHYPKDDAENTKGFAFIEFKNLELAEEAVKAFNKYRLDKSHTLLVNLFLDFQKYSDIPKERSPPEPQPYKVQNDLYTFMTEPDAQDEFCGVTESTPDAVQVQFWQNTQLAFIAIGLGVWFSKERPSCPLFRLEEATETTRSQALHLLLRTTGPYPHFCRSGIVLTPSPKKLPFEDFFNYIGNIRAFNRYSSSSQIGLIRFDP